jgi:hypothetical protein
VTVPLKVLIKVDENAQPVIDFLRSHGHDIGSVNADRLYHDAPSDMRFLCVGCADRGAVVWMAQAMRVAFNGKPRLIELTNRVACLPGPMETVVVVFLEIAAVEVAT